MGDLHVGRELEGELCQKLDQLSEQADLLLLAGDLTQHGETDEARLLARELIGVGVPIFAVLGNHDYHCNQEDEIRRMLEDVGVTVLEGEAATLTVRGVQIGIGGSKGFGGGFLGACGSEFGEPEMKAFIRHTKQVAEKFRGALVSLDVDLKIALLHFSPIEGTLEGERLEIYPFLGSYMLGEAVDRAGCMLAIHGHAHRGVERGITAGGVPVRNVARTVIQRAYKVFEIGCSRTDRKIDYHRTMV